MNANESELSAVLRRVQKLLAIAEDTRANPHEAAAAAAQAEKIMRKFQIDRADLITEELRSGRADFAEQVCPVVMKRDVGHKPRRVPTWGQWIAVRCARLNGCEARTTWTAETGAAILFIGYAPDVAVTAWTFNFIVSALIAEVRDFQKYATRTKAESESFRRGYVVSVIGALDRLREEREAAMAAAVDSRALVVVKAAAIAEHFGETQYKTTKVKARVADEAYIEGRRRGARLNVNQAVLH